VKPRQDHITSGLELTRMAFTQIDTVAAA